MQTEATRFVGMTLVDRDGDKVGQITTLYASEEGGQPTFATVRTGLFGSKETFFPVEQAQAEGDTVRVPYEKSLIKDAPRVEEDGHLSPEEEQVLWQHYGISGGWGGTETTGTTGAAFSDTEVDRTRSEGYDTSGPTTDDAMTRSEQQLQVGKTKEQTGVARLRKYVTTENVQTTVPVTKEKVTLEREPVTEANRDQALSGPELSDEEHEVTLTEERPVVSKETVPVERVRLGKEQVTEEHTVSEQVSKEQIEADGVYPEERGTRTTEGDRTKR